MMCMLFLWLGCFCRMPFRGPFVRASHSTSAHSLFPLVTSHSDSMIVSFIILFLGFYFLDLFIFIQRLTLQPKLASNLKPLSQASVFQMLESQPMPTGLEMVAFKWTSNTYQGHFQLCVLMTPPPTLPLGSTDWCSGLAGCSLAFWTAVNMAWASWHESAMLGASWRRRQGGGTPAALHYRVDAARSQPTVTAPWE